MSFGIIDAPLGVEHGHELRTEHVSVRKLLKNPPRVFAIAAIIVIAATDPSQRGGIDEVSITVDERAVASAVERYLRVPVEIAADELILLSGDGWAITSPPRIICNFSGGRRVRRIRR